MGVDLCFVYGECVEVEVVFVDGDYGGVECGVVVEYVGDCVVYLDFEVLCGICGDGDCGIVVEGV